MPSKATRPTSCSSLFHRALEAAAVATMQATAFDAGRAFAAGFWVGQIEKVYLGACHAAMFAGDEIPLDLNVIAAIARVYDLRVQEIQYPDSQGTEHKEVWVFRNDGSVSPAAMLDGVEPDTPHFHTARGLLCGIPLQRIDPDWNPRKDTDPE